MTTWTYDADGNRLTETKGAAVTNYTHDAAGQLASTSGGSGTTNYSYDNNGNRILSQPPSGAPTTFTWDAADRMWGNKLPNGKIVTNTYRYDDLRYGRQGQAGTDGQMWDGDALIAWSRKDNAGSTANQPAQAFTGPADGPELGRALGTQTGSGFVGVERQYHTDEQGTVLAISDDSQASAVTYQTDAWGNVQSGSATDQPLDYAGGLGYQLDPDSNLEYVRARYYDPTTGEWLSQDPIESEPPYQYVYNSPTVFVDPSGTVPDLSKNRKAGPVRPNKKLTSNRQDKAPPVAPTSSTDSWPWQARFSSEGRYKDVEHEAMMVGPIRHVESESGKTETSNPYRVHTAVSRMSPPQKLADAIARAMPRFDEVTRLQVRSLLSPTALKIMSGVLIAWVGSHAIGIGEFADLVLLGLGLATVGTSFLEGAYELYQFSVIAVNAQSGGDIEDAGEHFARAVVTLGIGTISGLLLKGSASRIPKRLPAVQKHINLGPTPPWRRLPEIEYVDRLPGGDRGITDFWGRTKVSIEGHANPWERAATEHHESVHRFVIQVARLFGRAGVQWRTNIVIRIQLLRAIEEAAAEMYGTIRADGIALSRIKAGIRWPVEGGYVTVSQVNAEGELIGNVLVGGSRLNVYFQQTRQSNHDR